MSLLDVFCCPLCFLKRRFSSFSFASLLQILNIVRERNPAKTEHRAQIFTQEITPVRVKRDIPEETVKQVSQMDLLLLWRKFTLV